MARKLPPFTAAIPPLFARALEQEIGISFIPTGIPRDSFKNMLYEVRSASGDPRLQELMIFAPAAPHDNEIWIAKKEVELDP